MGGHAYWYLVPYQADPQAALDALREREFSAGRYNPVISFIKFGDALLAQKPGAKHKSIGAAVRASAEDGTRSILDIEKIGVRPDYGVAAVADAAKLRDIYGTDKPTREMVADDRSILDDVARGQAIYFAVYAGGAPAELFFGGYSYD